MIKLHASSPPDIPKILTSLKDYQVDYILIGSYAAMLHGLKGQPGDFDITPKLSPLNLRRLAKLLKVMEARPKFLWAWGKDEEGNRKRIITEKDPTAVARKWSPQTNDILSFDHLVYTKHGNFDVVPDMTGTYEQLKETAVKMTCCGHTIWVSSIGDILNGMTMPRRPKDETRVKQLRSIQRALVRKSLRRRPSHVTR